MENAGGIFGARRLWAVLLGIGGYFGVRALALGREVTTECTELVCSEVTWQKIDEGRGAATAANVLIGVGLAAAATGTFFLITAPRSAKEPPPATAFIRFALGHDRATLGNWGIVLNRAKTRHTGMHCGAVIVALTGIGCATIAGLGEDFEHAAVCDPIVAPAASKVSNAGDTIEFVVALHTIDLDEEDDTPRYGYDMDGKRSGTLDGQSCKRPKFVDEKKVTCDDAARHRQQWKVRRWHVSINWRRGSYRASSPIKVQRRERGRSCIRVSKYSGTPNDDRVSVAVYDTPGMTAPAWNGTDVWPITDTSVGSSGSVDEPLVVDDAAYVVDGVLVAHWPNTRLSHSRRFP